MQNNKNKLTIKTKLLIYEYKEKYPSLSSQDIANMFNLSEINVNSMFKKGEIIIPSKMNK